jgi:hypothetical protein
MAPVGQRKVQLTSHLAGCTMLGNPPFITMASSGASRAQRPHASQATVHAAVAADPASGLLHCTTTLFIKG